MPSSTSLPTMALLRASLNVWLEASLPVLSVWPSTENLRSGLSVINLTIRLISPILSGLMVDLPTSKVMPYVMNLPSLIMRSYNGTAPLATRMLRMEVLFVKYPPPL